MSAIDRASPPVTSDWRQARNDQAAAERYNERQRKARRGRYPGGAPRPLKSDDPVPQRNSSLVRRVARLLNPL
jgi:hypothetical protein